jgi:hypothetical protein
MSERTVEVIAVLTDEVKPECEWPGSAAFPAPGVRSP